MESGGAKRRKILRRERERERFGTGRKEKSSLPRSIEAGEKGVREARHVLAGVKSIPAKERKTREKRGPSLAVLLLFRFWVDRSISAAKETSVKRRSVHDVSLTIHLYVGK